MRNSNFLVALALGFTFTACAQKAPESVTSNFSKKYPTAKSVKWEKENDKEWEAEFKMDGMEYSANFSNDGTWLETEKEMKEKDLPEAVKNILNSTFKGYEVEEVEWVETSEYSGYEMELEKGKETLEVVISKEGNVLKKVMADSEDKG